MLPPAPSVKVKAAVFTAALLVKVTTEPVVLFLYCTEVKL